MARTASGQLAARNKELETAKKNVEAAKDSVTAANNELAAAKNDTISTYSALTTKESTLATYAADTVAYRRTYDTAKQEWESEDEYLTTLKTQLNTLQTTGTTSILVIGVSEKRTFSSFIDKVLDGNKSTTPELYYRYNGTNTLFLSLKSGIKDGENNDLGFTEDKKVTPATWSTVFNSTELAKMPVKYITFYCEVKYKNNVIENGENKIIETVYYKGVRRNSGTGGSAFATLDAFADQLFDIFDAFSSAEEEVTMIDETAIAAKQKEVNDQTKVVAKAKTSYDNALANLNDRRALVKTAETAVATAKTAHNAAVTAFQTAQKKVQTAQSNLTSARKEVTRIEGEIATINDAVNAVNNYKNLSITANITIKEPKEGETLLTLGDWGSDCAINGNGYVITYPAGKNGNLTGVNRGIINNLGVVNGKITTTNAGSLKIAFETTDGTNYDIYDASGAHDASPMNGALAYRARPYFGVTINENGTFGTLAKKTADNTVYKAEWTNAITKKTTTFYTNATAEKLSYNPVADKVNTFAYVLDTDLNTTNRLTEATNVAVNVIQKDGSTKFICKNAKFTDEVAEGNDGYIYIPTDFTAENLTYDRKFKSSMYATVCLPFEVPAETLKAKGVTKKMQFSNVETATNTYWFRYQGDEEAMRANEPYVLKFKLKADDDDDDNVTIFEGGKIFSNLANIEIAATGSIDRFAVAPSNPGVGAEFLGVFISTNATQLDEGGNLYGFGDGLFRPMTISPDNKCLPFRTYVRTSSTGNVPAVTFNIGELDEDGNIVDGDETAISTTEADAFSVKGINGALVITSDKAQNVNIYTIGGSLVKATNVEAGSVTVPVAAGMYIVNGKKVFVK